jgi:multimeric flavodoxin WrbA
MIVGVNGSPNVNGNTGYLVTKVLEGAQSSKAETTLLQLGRMRVGPCVACMSCKRKTVGVCAVKDDMRRFYAEAHRLRGLVIGTPIYFDHISAQLKTFMDRLYAYIGNNMEMYFPQDIRAGLVVTYGAAEEGIYDGVVDWIAGRLKSYYGIRTLGAVKIGNCPDTLVVDRNVDILGSARRLGEELAAW